MKRYMLRIILLLSLVALLGACSSAPATPTTTMTYDRQFDFSGLRTVYIEPSSRTDAATIQVSDGQISRIDSALAAELSRKGYELVATSQQADLLLHWYLVTEDLVKASANDCSGCDMAAEGGARYSKGTLIVDMVDPMRSKAVWRSVLQTGLAAKPGTASAEQARLAAAAAIFARFPPQ